MGFLPNQGPRSVLMRERFSSAAGVIVFDDPTIDVICVAHV